jgi:hypothetical protein
MTAVPAVQMSLKSNVNNTKENKSSTRVRRLYNVHTHVIYILYIILQYNMFYVAFIA